MCCRPCSATQIKDASNSWSTRAGIALREASWKFIPKRAGAKRLVNTNTETGNDPDVQLYDLSSDPGEQRNVASMHPDRVNEMTRSVGHGTGGRPAMLFLQRPQRSRFTRKAEVQARSRCMQQRVGQIARDPLRPGNRTRTGPSVSRLSTPSRALIEAGMHARSGALASG
jgi:hypothetical protein